MVRGHGMEWEIDHQVGYYGKDHQEMLARDELKREQAAQSRKDKPYEIFALELLKVVKQLWPDARLEMNNREIREQTKLSELDISALDLMPSIQSSTHPAMIRGVNPTSTTMPDDGKAIKSAEIVFISKKTHEKPSIQKIISAANQQGIDITALQRAKESVLQQENDRAR